MKMKIELPGADITHIKALFETEQAMDLFRRLANETRWEQRDVVIKGVAYPQPRLTAWHGEGEAYTYSGLTLVPEPWTATLIEIRDRVEAETGVEFNSVLLNHYRDGRSSIGKHSDNEPELGNRPVLASVSFGGERDFYLEPKPWVKIPGARKEILRLESGSLLVMAGDTQRNYNHGIDKVRHAEPRINLTFRRIVRKGK